MEPTKVTLDSVLALLYREDEIQLAAKDLYNDDEHGNFEPWENLSAHEKEYWVGGVRLLYSHLGARIEKLEHAN